MVQTDRTLRVAERIAKFGVWEVELASGELRWSEGLFTIFGLDPATHAPSFELFASLLLPDERAAMAHKLELMLAGDDRYRSDDFLILRPDGDKRSVHIEIAFDTNSDGRAVRAIGTIQDVTAARLAQAQLERSHQALAEAERIGKFGTWDQDPRTGKMHWSAGLYRILGIDPRTPPHPDLFASLQHLDARTRVMRNMDRLAAGDLRNSTDDYVIVRPDGAERFLHGEAGFIRGPDGHVDRIIGSLQDVTEAKRVAERLSRSEQSLAHAQRIARVGSYEVDVLTGESRWSNGLFELFGLDPAKHEPSFELFTSLIHPDDRATVERRASSLWAGDATQEIVDWRMVGADGADRLFHAEIEAERDGTGRLVRVFGTVQDVTAQRATELALQKALDTAQAADRAKSEFLANMSHELRTPLNAIIGFSEFLLADFAAGAPQETRREYLRDIHASGEHLLDIINGILSLSKIESGHGALEEDVFAVRDIVAWALRFVRERARTGNVTLTVEVKGDLPLIRADRRLIRQTLLNLLTNAIKFTRAGGWARIHATPTREGGLAVSVADSGIGMRPEDLPVALAPFGQLDASLSRRFEGTGLGLPLAQKFIELHDGELAIDSQPGKGTTVTLTLPRARCIPNGASI